MTRWRPGASIGAALVLAAALTGCDEVSETSGEPPKSTCVQLAGTWNIVLEMDTQLPGMNLCHVTWQIDQSGCSLTIPAALPCSMCCLWSPACWGASGEAGGTPESTLRMEWTPETSVSCSYFAILDAQSDGATISGTMRLIRFSAPDCTGNITWVHLSGTRQ